jgi:urea transport system ATP-binding protein
VTLVVDGLRVRYGPVEAVRGLSLEVKPGEIVGLIGPNGAGKSSTLNAIMGAAPVAGGEIRLDGASIRGQRSEDVARAGVALVPEGRRIFAELTVEENLRLGLAARRTPGGIDSVFELFPVIQEFRRRQAGALSGGQQQQLAIARALVMKPRLLVLDEPTEGIQPSIIKDIGRVIALLRSQGEMAILLVEQYFDFARDLAQTIVVMDRGDIVLSGRREELNEEDVRRRLSV